MIEKINEAVCVELVFNSRNNKIFPARLRWKNRVYQIKKVGLHHFFKTGKTLFHVFSVTDGKLFFRLVLNTDNLHWTLEEIADDSVN